MSPEHRVTDPDLLRPGTKIKLYTPHGGKTSVREGTVLFFGHSRPDSMIARKTGVVYVDDEHLHRATHLRDILSRLSRDDVVPELPPFALFIPLRDLGMGDGGWFPGVSYVEITAQA
jgi:hypothetical protein